jgi:hypothetical protein
MQRATASCLTTSAALPSFSAHAGHRPPCSIARHRPLAQFFVYVLVLAWTDDKKRDHMDRNKTRRHANGGVAETHLLFALGCRVCVGNCWVPCSVVPPSLRGVNGPSILN